MLERRPVLPLENVLWHDVNANIVLVGHKEEEPRRWDLEVDHHRIRVGRRRLLDGLLDVDAPAYLRAEVAQAVQRKGNVFGAKRLPIAPSNPGPRLYRQPLVVRREFVALRQPHIGLVRKSTVIGEGS